MISALAERVPKRAVLLTALLQAACLGSRIPHPCGARAAGPGAGATRPGSGRVAAAGARAATTMAQPKPPGTVRLLLTGDIMLGRGVDQILPHHVGPAIYEGWVKDARDYVALAEEANGPLPSQRGPDYPWGFALSDIAAMAPDAFVVNLETAMTTHPEPWPQKGINYRSHPANVATLKASGVDVAVLSNNHAVDWGFAGLEETLATLEGAGLRVAGAGRNASEAARPAVVPLGRRTAAGGGSDGGGGTEAAPAPHAARQAAPAPAPGGEAAASEGAAAGAGAGAAAGAAAAGRVLVWGLGHSSSGVPDAWAAGASSPGVALTDLSPADAARIAAAVAAAKRPGDVAVVSLHWGSNWGFAVPREQRAFARALVDGGVDVVHGHSSHHARGFEVYRGRLITYGCGDLISDYEGISNASVEARYPPESHRDDVGLLWYADVGVGGGALAGLTLTPTRLRHLRLEPPEPGDWDYIQSTMDREACRHGLEGGVVRQEGGPAGGRLRAVLPAAAAAAH
ncbi:hypothetical protein Rsub_12169 [Raphidocelis subcapitata]|uniref:Capsule synthesis protein CapA domain-containing protein n=1 Tax=Raphidocelis subcapitata TaxID=307507 RepID=A0A2V0PQ86_9CHLO|nr:hypothetical protein Rsub_12169 [Raphidocelis subcapitata]|eukprot:GBF99365.1 hypothetical protein Rsub_12169 [Raphidocelis subcapitata]